MPRFAQRLRDEAAWFRSQANDPDADAIADILEEAARIAAFLRCDHGWQYRDRLDVLRGHCREEVAT